MLTGEDKLGKCDVIEIKVNWRQLYVEPTVLLIGDLLFVAYFLSMPELPQGSQEWLTVGIMALATVGLVLFSVKYMWKFLVPIFILFHWSNGSVYIKAISGSQRLSSCNDLLAIQQTAATKFRPGLFVLNFTTGRNIYLLDDGSNELVQFLTELSRYSKVSISELDHYDSTKTRPQSSAESTLYTISVY